MGLAKEMRGGVFPGEGEVGLDDEHKGVWKGYQA